LAKPVNPTPPPDAFCVATHFSVVTNWRTSPVSINVFRGKTESDFASFCTQITSKQNVVPSSAPGAAFVGYTKNRRAWLQWVMA
jgi:hypothetical protein